MKNKNEFAHRFQFHMLETKIERLDRLQAEHEEDEEEEKHGAVLGISTGNLLCRSKRRKNNEH